MLNTPRAAADHNVDPPALEARIPPEIRAPRSRWGRARYIAGLDAERDCQAIGYLLACYEFPWDTNRALELALLRTFGIAKGTPLLVATGDRIGPTRTAIVSSSSAQTEADKGSSLWPWGPFVDQHRFRASHLKPAAETL